MLGSIIIFFIFDNFVNVKIEIMEALQQLLCNLGLFFPFNRQQISLVSGITFLCGVAVVLQFLAARNLMADLRSDCNCLKN